MEVIFGNHKLPRAIEKQIATELVVPGDFGPIDVERLRTVSKRFHVRKEICKCIRAQYIRQKIIDRYYIPVKYTGSTERLEQILQLSKKYDKPPVNIYRQLGGKNKQFESTLYKHDVFVGSVDPAVVAGARQFEIDLEEALTRHGIRYYTQEDLIPRQQKQYGRAVATPDILLKDLIRVDNNEIKWIDCKNYYASYLPYIRKSIEKQGNKYADHFGNGVFLFSLGCSELYFDRREFIFRG